MTEFTTFDFAESDYIDADVIDGYGSGYRGDREPGSDKSRSFFHGWKNGRVDGGHDPIDERQQEFARAFVANQRSH